MVFQSLKEEHFPQRENKLTLFLIWSVKLERLSVRKTCSLMMLRDSRRISRVRDCRRWKLKWNSIWKSQHVSDTSWRKWSSQRIRSQTHKRSKWSRASSNSKMPWSTKCNLTTLNYPLVYRRKMKKIDNLPKSSNNLRTKRKNTILRARKTSTSKRRPGKKRRNFINCAKSWLIWSIQTSVYKPRSRTPRRIGSLYRIVLYLRDF